MFSIGVLHLYAFDGIWIFSIFVYRHPAVCFSCKTIAQSSIGTEGANKQAYTTKHSEFLFFSYLDILFKGVFNNNIHIF